MADWSAFSVTGTTRGATATSRTHQQAGENHKGKSKHLCHGMTFVAEDIEDDERRAH